MAGQAPKMSVTTFAWLLACLPGLYSVLTLQYSIFCVERNGSCPLAADVPQTALATGERANVGRPSEAALSEPTLNPSQASMPATTQGPREHHGIGIGTPPCQFAYSSSASRRAFREWTDIPSSPEKDESPLHLRTQPCRRVEGPHLVNGTMTGFRVDPRGELRRRRAPWVHGARLPAMPAMPAIAPPQREPLTQECAPGHQRRT